MSLYLLYTYVLVVSIITTIHLSVIILLEYGNLYNIFTLPAALQFEITFRIIGFDLLFGLIIISSIGFFIKIR